MCGITAILNHGSLPAGIMAEANALVAHRGPDDEGFLLWKSGESFRLFSGTDSSESSIQVHALPPLPAADTHWKIGLGHRRLSILDLTPAGHQPMIEQNRWTISYNGEIFNYLEIKQELEQNGYVFQTASDTEVILKAWACWGRACLHRFNGMFSFVLLDRDTQTLYAVRDRFGIKPLYYTRCSTYTAIVSEVKQLRILPEYRFSLNRKIAYDYLNDSLLDHEEETFEEGILQVMPGCYLEINCSDNSLLVHRWYQLQPIPWQGTEEEAFKRLEFLLKDSVKIRLRSDVPVGAALSGGLDSSVLVGLMRELMGNEATLTTISSCSEDKRFDEWQYAWKVIEKVKALYHQVYPSFDKLTKDFDRLLWYMDYPFLGTSQFSQWCVFEEAGKQGLPVMINGQGADEQLAGYGGNEVPLFTGLLRKGAWRSWWKEVKAYKQYKGTWPLTFVAGAFQYFIPTFIYSNLPHRLQFFKQKELGWLKEKVYTRPIQWFGSLNDSLQSQVQRSPLPSLLRYDDRNSMAFSVESRVPFMDHRLIEFTLGLPEHMVLRQGERKYILRKAFEHLLPLEVKNRKDKMGFVSSEERWMKEEGKAWYEQKVAAMMTQDIDLIDPLKAVQHVHKMQQGVLPFNSEAWRIICFSKWLHDMKAHKYSLPKPLAS